MRRITLDIETTSSAGFDMSQMELSVVGFHDSETDTYDAFEVSELHKFWPLIEKTDLIVGFNSNHFDIPILNKYYAGDLTRIRSLDILEKIKESLGRRIKLDSIAKATLGRKKTGHGLDAVKWWEEGEYEKVKQYCIEDVKITKEIYDFALKEGYLQFSDFGEKKKIPLDTSSWESGEASPLTHTIPF
ncbi:helicase [Candidatus Kaiserbacteria bacterium CG10_big_fil_rev_8_21_14_0_10_45_20]|uniref:Helicase n=1 Tax=Candidatus Kaiserbacteria bacterium CG10_big_fil_rev_8_21_14_0_10_45_20 TaxID=1974607 RepID=A0A2H0UGF1_9BACT|nr:MAG: helicase [Candidatus Kaiserbacteria bacterium CG10_big_fil_rev_8_21_14_0_10_45_20]